MVQPSEEKRRGWCLEDVLGICTVSVADSENIIELDLLGGEKLSSLVGYET